jgi:ribosome biogenesis GTPase A
MKNTPVDDKILGRLQELGLGSRRGKTQANRRLRNRAPAPVSNSGGEFLRHMTPPSAFSGRTRIVASCSRGADFPPEGARKEIAFAGRSNVGKSSLLNNLLGKVSGMPDAALVEDKPGVTRNVSFYDIGKQLRLVDLPGETGKALETTAFVAHVLWC